jgi:glycosyltransferase involved in cell wall biosynthesis
LNPALIISVYKNVKDLEVVLRSVEQQTHSDIQIIISEDGKSDEMHDFVSNYTGKLPLTHFTQEDIGWRKNRSLNFAIKNTPADYLIFIDGDCVLHPHFLENHVNHAQPNRILAGKRIKLGPMFSTQLRNTQSIDEFSKSIIKNYRAIKNDHALFYISPNSFWSILPNLRKMNQLKGCNFSCYKKALDDINGFDEDYQLPAIGEDIDLTWRFKGLNYQLYSVRNYAVQYHLHHKENWLDQSENLKRMNTNIKEKRYVAANGISKRNGLI